MIDEIKLAIETKIKPKLAEHKGDIELVSEKDGVVEVKLLGACSGCPSARFTIEELVESVLLEIPGVKKVKLADPVSEEMIAFARNILKK
jgi:Fe-S cluster biogenesis protein NfuA